MEKFAGIILGIMFLVVIILVVGLVFAAPLMLMINYIFSSAALIAVFGGPITFSKSFWLLFLSMFLFKSNATSSSN